MEGPAGWHVDPETNTTRWWTGTEWGVTKDTHQRLLGADPTPSAPTLPPPRAQSPLPPPNQAPLPPPSTQPLPSPTTRSSLPPPSSPRGLPSPAAAVTHNRHHGWLWAIIISAVLLILAGIVVAVWIATTPAPTNATTARTAAQHIVHDLNTNNQTDLCTLAPPSTDQNNPSCNPSSNSTAAYPTTYHGLVVHVVVVSGHRALATVTGSACIGKLCLATTNPRAAFVSTSFDTNYNQAREVNSQSWALPLEVYGDSWKFTAPLAATPVTNGIAVPSLHQWVATYGPAVATLEAAATAAQTTPVPTRAQCVPIVAAAQALRAAPTTPLASANQQLTLALADAPVDSDACGYTENYTSATLPATLTAFHRFDAIVAAQSTDVPGASKDPSITRQPPTPLDTWYTQAHPVYQSLIAASTQITNDAQTYLNLSPYEQSIAFQSDCAPVQAAQSAYKALPPPPYGPGVSPATAEGIAQGYTEGIQVCTGAPNNSSPQPDKFALVSTGLSQEDQAAAALVNAGA